MVTTFVAEEVISVICECRVVEKSPPYGVVADYDVELMLHSSDESSDSSVALLKTKQLVLLYLQHC